MATAKITVTLPLEQLKEVRIVVKKGKARSVSAFVQHAVEIALNDAAEWKQMLNDALEETGGPLTKQECDRIDSLFASGASKREPKKRKAA